MIVGTIRCDGREVGTIDVSYDGNIIWSSYPVDENSSWGIRHKGMPDYNADAQPSGRGAAPSDSGTSGHSGYKKHAPSHTHHAPESHAERASPHGDAHTKGMPGTQSGEAPTREKSPALAGKDGAPQGTAGIKGLAGGPSGESVEHVKATGDIDRSQFRKELADHPELIRKMATMVKGEVGTHASLSTQKVQLETAFNRAQMRGHSLEKALRPVRERGGYYANATYSHPASDAEVEAFKRDVLAPVMAGSNESRRLLGFEATGNASGGLAQRQARRMQHGFLPAAGGGREGYFFERSSHDHPLARLSGSGQASAEPESQSAVPVTGGGKFTDLPHQSSANLEHVDPRLREIMGAAATHLPPGYTARVTPHGGYSPTHGDSGSQHRRGKAMDIQIRGPNGDIPNEGADTTGMYQRLAQAGYGEMLARYPELQGSYNWGGAHGTHSGGGPRDLMHYDIGGERGHLGQYRPSSMGVLPGEKYGTGAAAPAASGGGSREKFVNEMRSHLGKAGNDPDMIKYLRDGPAGLDPRKAEWCAATLRTAASHAGVSPDVQKRMDNTAAGVGKLGTQIEDIQNLRPGDLVVYRNPDYQGGVPFDSNAVSNVIKNDKGRVIGFSEIGGDKRSKADLNTPTPISDATNKVTQRYHFLPEVSAEERQKYVPEKERDTAVISDLNYAGPRKKVEGSYPEFRRIFSD